MKGIEAQEDYQMSVVVRIPTPLRRVTNGQDKASVDGDNLVQIIESLEAQYPGLKERAVR